MLQQKRHLHFLETFKHFDLFFLSFLLHSQKLSSLGERVEMPASLDPVVLHRNRARKRKNHLSLNMFTSQIIHLPTKIVMKKENQCHVFLLNVPYPYICHGAVEL